MTLMFHSTGISYRFRDKRQFQSKIANFPIPCVFCAPTEGVPVGIGYRRWGGQKTRMMGIPSRERNLTISSAKIQYINVTDRRTDTGRQQRPRLRHDVKKIGLLSIDTVWIFLGSDLLYIHFRDNGQKVNVKGSHSVKISFGPAVTISRDKATKL